MEEKITCYSCGLIDFPEIRNRGIHRTAFCNGCGKYIKHLAKPGADPDDFVFYFGKFKGMSAKQLSQTTDGVDYLKWAYENITNLKEGRRAIIAKLLGL